MRANNSGCGHRCVQKRWRSASSAACLACDTACRSSLNTHCQGPGPVNLAWEEESHPQQVTRHGHSSVPLDACTAIRGRHFLTRRRNGRRSAHAASGTSTICPIPQNIPPIQEASRVSTTLTALERKHSVSNTPFTMSEWTPYLEAATQLKVSKCTAPPCTQNRAPTPGHRAAPRLHPGTLMQESSFPCSDQQEQGRRRRLRVRRPVSALPRRVSLSVLNLHHHLPLHRPSPTLPSPPPGMPLTLALG